MIQSYINSVVPLTANDSSVTFQEDCIRTGSCNGCKSWLCHNRGSANYDITQGGIYEIDFDVTATSATAGVIAFSLFVNGEPVPGTLMAETLATAGDYANLGVNKKIRVCCNANSTVSVRAVPTVPNAITPATPIATQVPIIANANFSISRIS